MNILSEILHMQTFQYVGQIRELKYFSVPEVGKYCMKSLGLIEWCYAFAGSCLKMLLSQRTDIACWYSLSIHITTTQ
jgi:hypothetical protein